jgi:hypothetical protein
MGNISFIERFLRDIGEISEKISREDIDSVIRVLYDAWREGRQVFIAENVHLLY